MPVTFTKNMLLFLAVWLLGLLFVVSILWFSTPEAFEVYGIVTVASSAMLVLGIMLLPLHITLGILYPKLREKKN